MKRVLKKLALLVLLLGLVMLSGCISCIPYYTAPPEGPVSSCYPAGHDPFIPKDHNPSILNPWDAISAALAPVLYGPPR